LILLAPQFSGDKTKQLECIGRAVKAIANFKHMVNEDKALTQEQKIQKIDQVRMIGQLQFP
jgi:hypothetical protein